MLLLSIDGARITPLPLHQRKAMLAKLVAAVGDEHLQFSGEFKRPDQAARDLSENEPRGHRFEAAAIGLPVRTYTRLAEGQDGDWRAENRGRWELFEKRR